MNAVAARVEAAEPYVTRGKVEKVVGMVVEGYAPKAKVGSLCRIFPGPDTPPIAAEVVGFRGHTALMMPLGDIRGVRMGSTIEVATVETAQPVGPTLLGRVIDGMGQPIDDKGPLRLFESVPLYGRPLNPLDRKPITEALELGIRALDGLLTCGRGQRLAIMAGSGVGKSVLLGMIAQHTRADVKVIALIGERGREVVNFIQNNLSEKGLATSVVIAAASDQPPLIRMRGAFVATAIAEYFRNQGLSVLLMMDSVTRFAMAQREIGLAVGEPPTTKGYTPSVFAALPRLLERAGTSSGEGSITGLYTVLVEADDLNDPIADSVRSILDGHVSLSREIAQRNLYPAVDVLASISRVMTDVVDPRQTQLANKIRELLASYKKAEDLINIGAYVKGANPRIDEALSRIDAITNFLRQGIRERASMEQTTAAMESIFAEPPNKEVMA
ncbi:MAG: FliI/YscN family ATPase [Myxococcales bacterium]|nr:MAG: FliI/YscN family ATPase [Myxococcales bacterium]